MQEAVHAPCTHPRLSTRIWEAQLRERLCTPRSSRPACGLRELGTVTPANIPSSAGAAAHALQLGANLSQKYIFDDVLPLEQEKGIQELLHWICRVDLTMTPTRCSADAGVPRLADVG